MTTEQYTLSDLLQLMARLRDPDGGCPWDLAQDFTSIVPSTLEECYELVEAIEQQDFPHVAEELGDVLFQVVFYAQLGAERDLFAFSDIVDTLVRKLLRRHPHVFADGRLDAAPAATGASSDDVKHQWEAIKQEERAARAQTGLLDDVPLALPALPRAQKLQKRAARANFDWSTTEGVLAKIEEETAELRQAIADGGAAEVSEELGDLLFSCVNLSRHLGLDAESTLRRASTKFERRFRAMEQFAAAQRKTLETMSELELDALWRAAKASRS